MINFLKGHHDGRSRLMDGWYMRDIRGHGFLTHQELGYSRGTRDGRFSAACTLRQYEHQRRSMTETEDRLCQEVGILQ